MQKDRIFGRLSDYCELVKELAKEEDPILHYGPGQTYCPKGQKWITKSLEGEGEFKIKCRGCSFLESGIDKPAVVKDP